MDVGEFIAGLRYKPGWTFKLGGPARRYLCIFATTPDSSHPERQRCTQHMFEIPDLEGRDLVRWVHQRLLDAERHEAGEFFTVNGHRPFYPQHQGLDPYEHVEHWEETP